MIFVCGTSWKPASAAFPVSPDVATRMRIVACSPVFLSAVDMSCGSSWSAMSLNALVGPCQSSSTLRSCSSRVGARRSLSNFAPP